MMSYVVTWSIEFDAESTVDAADAAGQAWGCIEDALHGGPATVLVVRDENDRHLGTFDMADGLAIERGEA